MAISLIRSKAMITHVTGRDTWNEVPDGAVLQEHGTIVALGSYADLHARHPGVPVIGTGAEVLLPGFVNGHHHVGLTPLQLGSPDMPLELWFVTRMVMRRVNLYLDTLYAAFEMVASGVTTVQHIHGWAPGNLKQVEAQCDDVLRAYDDIGMRVSYCFAVREQNRLVYQDDTAFLESLPRDLQGPMRRWYDRIQLTLDDYMSLFESLFDRHNDKPRTRIQLAPANLHWCTDTGLARIADASEKRDVPMHMHLLETAYQKEYAIRRGGLSALEHIDRFGMLGPRMTLGHGVWLNESDIARVAATGTCICHNCSSNFRLRSGIAPLNRFAAAGIEVALGIDEAGINDDRDMLQEMRLVLRAHRTPGMIDEDVPTPSEVFRMATQGGARTTPYRDRIGRIAVGGAADLVLIDHTQFAYPYLDPETRLLDAVIQRAKSQGVRTVLCEGAVIYDQGRFTRVDREAALAQLHAELGRALADDELERRALAKALLPHARAFYRGYMDPAGHDPFYRASSRI